MMRAYKKGDVIVTAFRTTLENREDESSWPLWLFSALNKKKEIPGAVVIHDDGKWSINSNGELKEVPVDTWIIRISENQITFITNEKLEAEYVETIALNVAGKMHEVSVVSKEETEERIKGFCIATPIVIITIFAVFKLGIMLSHIKHIETLSTVLLIISLMSFFATLLSKD